MKIHKIIGLTIRYLVILGFAVLFLAPLFWMLMASFSDVQEINSAGLLFIPKKFHFENYRYALTLMPFGRYALNTILVTALTIIGTVLSCSMAAYAFARLKAPGKEGLFLLVLSTVMLPSMVTCVPQFIIFKSLKMYDTLWPLILPAFFGNAMYIFLFRQFFLTIPLELSDAAKIDGCSDWQTFWKVIMPISKPVTVSVLVFTFVAHWNDFMTPLIYLNSVKRRTLALGLATFSDVQGVDVVSLMAASTVTLIPIVIIFLICQKVFVKGIVTGSVKG
ncbi:MAG: carbohydrate ABC transporter permease [Armatimonadetes bacterium]|nr:carbohydrate ABC transporter permease [Candidatus Hippobium faecium]